METIRQKHWTISSKNFYINIETYVSRST